MSEKDNLLYIGKSNRKFTHNKIYKYHGDLIIGYNDYYKSGYLSVTSNRNHIIVTFRFEHVNYFNKNFKFITDQERNNLIRKLKLKKISKNDGFF